MFGYFWFGAILALAQGENTNKVITEGYELKYVQAIIRSPEHSPSKAYFEISKSLNISLTLDQFKPYGYDAIYPKGKKRMHDNGVSLKNRYSGFLSENKIVEVLSYDYNPGKHGVLITREALEGMAYENVKHKNYSTEELEEPFNAHLINDIIYPFAHFKCSAYENEILKLEKQHKDLFKQYKKKLTEVDDKFGEFEHPQYYFLLHEMYRMHVDSGRKKEPWFTKSQKELIAFLGKYMTKDVSTPKLKQLNGGRFAHHLLQEVEKVKNGHSCNKMVLLCVSPHMLRGLIAALGGEQGYRKPSMTYVDKYPEYGAMFLIEVYEKKDKGTYYFRFLYKNVNEDKYNRLYLEGCSELCEFTKFKNMLKSVILTKEGLKEVCATDDPK